MSKLRVGYILDDSDQSFFIWDSVNKAKLSESYSVEALIIQRPSLNESKSFAAKIFHYANKRGLGKLFERALFEIIKRFESAIVVINPKFKEFLNKYPLEQFQIPPVLVSPKLSPSGLVYEYKDEDLRKIRDLKLDLLVRGGSGILSGDILTVCRFGIISFHHGNNSVNRGGPPGFWEVFNREPTTGFIIQRLLRTLDGGDVLLKGNIATSFFYTLNLCKLYFKSNIFLHLLIERIAIDDKLPEILPKSPYSYPLYTTPTISQQIAYLFKTFFYALNKIWGKVLGKSYRWGIAYLFVKDWKSAVLREAKIIRNPPNRFLADPFVKVWQGRTVVYAEDYNYATSRGKISAYELFDSGYKELGTVLEENFHLSYPYLFDVDGSLYMCPETYESNDIRIYKCVEFPLRWELHKILVNNVSAVDTNIFKYNGKFWMLTNIDSSPLGDYGSELHLFYADNFDATEWIPHPNNPLVFDALKARNGGFIHEGTDLYRVFQTQGFDRYGAAMGVAKITNLEIDSYSEELVCEIPPKFFKHLKGTHTLSYDSGALLIDFIKHESYRK